MSRCHFLMTYQNRAKESALTLRNAFYMVVKSTGKQTEVTDANRQERRQKTGSNEVKQEKKGGKKGPHVELDVIVFLFFYFNV